MFKYTLFFSLCKFVCIFSCINNHSTLLLIIRVNEIKLSLLHIISFYIIHSFPLHEYNVHCVKKWNSSSTYVHILSDLGIMLVLYLEECRSQEICVSICTLFPFSFFEFPGIHHFHAVINLNF